MDASLAIRCEKVSKVYRRFSRKRKFQTLKSAILGGEILKDLAVATDAIHALWPIDLAVPKGEALGIVGGNGSGKSTLMKIIYGTTKPTTGTVATQGRVSALIELGAGFHPEISGRENVVINGIMVGLSRKEIARRFEEIVAFAELEDFIDAPVKTYSSGMYARLGFAVAITVTPEILLIDEVLSVGDEAFTHKCLERIRGLKAEGRTIVLVTHDLGMVEKVCDRALWLKGGRLQEDGDPRRVIGSYRMDVARHEEGRLAEQHRDTAAALSEGATAKEEPVQEVAPVPPMEGPAQEEEIRKHRWGSGDVEITAVTLRGGDGAERHIFAAGERLEIRLDVRPRVPVKDFVFGIGIFSEDGVNVYGTNTQIEKMTSDLLDAPATVAFVVESLELCEGAYRLDVAVHREDGMPYDYQRGLYSFRVTSDVKDIGLHRPRHSWTFGGAIRFKTRA
ncbi:MAG: ABC transporter ATP-binding protein [Acidobacteriota bacterium]